MLWMEEREVTLADRAGQWVDLGLATNGLAGMGLPRWGNVFWTPPKAGYKYVQEREMDAEERRTWCARLHGIPLSVLMAVADECDVGVVPRSGWEW